MSDQLTATMTGLDTFNRDMLEISGPIAVKIARSAVRAGGRVMQATIAQMAPQRPDLPSGTALPVGALRADIELRTIQESNGSVSALIGPGKFTAHVARWIEYGHEQARGTKGKFVPAHPFIRPAAATAEAEALAATEVELSAQIGKEAARLGYV